mgnify:FL=1
MELSVTCQVGSHVPQYAHARLRPASIHESQTSVVPNVNLRFDRTGLFFHIVLNSDIGHSAQHVSDAKEERQEVRGASCGC